MRCDVSGAAYAIFWTNQNGEMVMAGDYATNEYMRELYAVGRKKSFAAQSQAYAFETSGDGPVATCWRTKEPIFIKDVSTSNVKRKDLAKEYMVDQICFAPIESGVLEFGTSVGPLTATWEKMPDCALINKAALSHGFENLGASHAMFWVKEGDCFKVAADYVSEEQRKELRIMRGDDATFCSMSRGTTIAADGVNPVSLAADAGQEVAVVDTSIMDRSELAKEFGIHRMHFVPSEAGVLEFGIPENNFLNGDTLSAALKMTCEANGAGYALYWRLVGDQASVFGDYISPALKEALDAQSKAWTYAEGSKALTLDALGDGPVASVHRMGEPLYIQDVATFDKMKRRDLAAENGIQSICFIPVPGGVLEYGTSSDPSTADWNSKEDACNVTVPKAVLEKAFDAGATHAIFWNKKGGAFGVVASYITTERAQYLKELRGDDKSYTSESASVMIPEDSQGPVASAARAGTEITLNSPGTDPNFRRAALAAEFKVVSCHFVPFVDGVLEYGTGTK